MWCTVWYTWEDTLVQVGTGPPSGSQGCHWPTSTVPAMELPTAKTRA